jgi:molecular chaperone Hsp33
MVLTPVLIDTPDTLQDQLVKVLFEPHGYVRAEAVHVTEAWQHIVAQHSHVPTPILCVLGEMLAACIVLAGSITLNGSVILQITGDGPVALLVAECNGQRGIRATVTLRDADAVAAMITRQNSALNVLTDLINCHGSAQCLLTLDPDQKLHGQQAWHGVVDLQHDSVAKALMQYMHQSAQLQTQLWLAATSSAIGGLMLQQMPDHGGTLATDYTDLLIDHTQAAAIQWQHLVALAQSIQPNELTQYPAQLVLHRLFWQENMTVLSIESVAFECTCSRQKVERMLHQLGVEELNTILQTQSGQIDVNCHYCNTPYVFDAIDVAALFEHNHEHTVVTGNHTLN